eukprot:363049-Chlamydomonas_euryale.AAC.28
MACWSAAPCICLYSCVWPSTARPDPNEGQDAPSRRLVVLGSCATAAADGALAIGSRPRVVPILDIWSHVSQTFCFLQVDLDANFFGDIGAAAFIPFLAQAKHMRKFRITARGTSRAVGGAIGVILKDNHPKKKGTKKAKKK